MTSCQRQTDWTYAARASDAFEPKPGVEIHAKLESRNPGGSVKDRAALAMVEDASGSGVSSGAGSARRDLRQHRHRLRDARRRARIPRAALRARQRHARTQARCSAPTAPTSSSPIRWTAPTARFAKRAGSTRATRRVLLRRPVQQRRQLARALRDDRRRDPRADRRACHALRRRPRHERHVRRHGAAASRRAAGCRAHRRQPDSPLHGLEGLKHMATAHRAGIYDPSARRRRPRRSDRRRARDDARLAREAGLLVGPSSGAALAAATRGRARRSTAASIVTVFPDGGDRYLV